MYDTIKQLLNSSIYKPKLDEVVDLTYKFLTDPDKETFAKTHGMKVDEEVLGQFKVFDDNARYVESDTFDMTQFKLRRNMTIGSLTAIGGEVPSTSMGSLIKVDGGMAKMTLSHIFDENTMEQMIKLRQANVIPEDFIDLLFGSVNDLQTKVFKLGNVLCSQVWSTGKIRFSDPRTNVMLSIDYDTYPELFPDPLTGTLTWDNHDTARGIYDLIEHSRAYYRINSVYPKCYKMGEALVNHLLQQESTATYATSMGLINNHPTSGLPSRVTRKVLNQMVEDVTELPPIHQWDARYELELEPNKSASFPYNPSHTVTAVNTNSVERVWGLTIESTMNNRRKGFGTRRAQSSKPKGGIFLCADEILDYSPIQTRSLAAGRNIPWVSDTRRLGALKVLAA